MDLRDQIAEIVYTNLADAAARPGTTAARIVNTVMGVVEAEIERRTVLVCSDERHQARVRALEDENQRTRDTIASRIVEEERAVQRKILKDPTNPSLAGLLVGLQRARDIASTPAREIAEEEA